MSDDWEVLTLGDCADWYSGGTPKTSVPEYWNGDIPWITASSLHDFYIRDSERRVTPLGLENGTRLMPKDTILFVVRGMSLKTEFRVGISRCSVAFGQDCKALIPKEGIAPLFLANVLRGRAEEILGLVDEASHGTGRLATDVLQHFKVWLPPLDEQKEITALLAALDDKIENLRRQNETLEAIAQTLFKHWFVDFEFPYDFAQGRPNADGKPYKSSGGEMVPSELGEIPAGWRVGQLRDITEVINGRAYKQTEFKEEGTPIVRIQNLTGAGKTVYSDLDLDADKYISKGDLIYAWSATFGPYIWRGVKSIYHYHIWKLKCFNPVFKYYLYIHLKEVSDRVKNQGTGSIFTHITKQLMESQELFVPNNDVMEHWHGLAKSVFDKIMSNHEQIETLTTTRDVLLPKLMSGKLRIREG